MVTKTDEQRAAFEAWRKRHYPQFTAASDEAEFAESAWQAAIENQQKEIDRLQRIIDSRPALNEGLTEAYIKWTQSIYVMDAANGQEPLQ